MYNAAAFDDPAFPPADQPFDSLSRSAQKIILGKTATFLGAQDLRTAANSFRTFHTPSSEMLSEANLIRRALVNFGTDGRGCVNYLEKRLGELVKTTDTALSKELFARWLKNNVPQQDCARLPASADFAPRTLEQLQELEHIAEQPLPEEYGGLPRHLLIDELINSAIQKLSPESRKNLRCSAALNGHLEIVNVLLQNYIPTEQELGIIAVLAARGGHLHILQLLHDTYGFSENVLGAAAVMAASKGHQHLVHYLLNSYDFTQALRGGVALAAAANGHLEIFQLVFRAADPLVSEVIIGKTICAAAENGHLEMVRFLLEKGPSQNSREEALRNAAARGHTEIFCLLYRQGPISKSTRAMAGEAAAQGGHFRIAHALLVGGPIYFQPLMLGLLGNATLVYGVNAVYKLGRRTLGKN
ncbi:MAG TPA: ankyrin repeat domain-containing protein [Rhabdochlamydiaceae bacterium]